MRESIYFNYDGISSRDMGLVNVNIQNGMFEETFVGDRTIKEVTIRSNDKPYLQGVQRNPLSFSLTFAFEDTFDGTALRSIARWLDVDYYKPFFTEDNPNRIFYCMPSGQTSITHNGEGKGYITVTMRCDSPYSYSNYITTPNYDYSTNTTTTTLTISNDGDVNIQPELWIEKVGLGDVQIKNTTTDVTMVLTQITDGETVYVNSEREEVQTDLMGTYRFDNLNDTFLSLVIGANTLEITGTCRITLKYRYKLLQG
jgi:phage-related protein